MPSLKTMAVRTALFAVSLLSLSPAQAIDRAFPDNIFRGKMTPAYFPDIKIDGKMRRLSPAARIFNQDNAIEMPAALRGSDIAVNYTVNGMGEIDRVWLLTTAEAARPAASATTPAPTK